MTSVFEFDFHTHREEGRAEGCRDMCFKSMTSGPQVVGPARRLRPVVSRAELESVVVTSSGRIGGGEIHVTTWNLPDSACSIVKSSCAPGKGKRKKKANFPLY